LFKIHTNTFETQKTNTFCLFVEHLKNTTVLSTKNTREHVFISGTVHGSHLEGNSPIVLPAVLAVVLVHFHSVLPHQQQVPHEGFKVELAEDNALQLAGPCDPDVNIYR
jgi:hypothetical protein